MGLEQPVNCGFRRKIYRPFFWSLKIWKLTTENWNIGIKFETAKEHKKSKRQQKKQTTNMTKKAEGRGKDLPTEMPSETQRMMVRDMRDFRISGFNPFDHESY